MSCGDSKSFVLLPAQSIGESGQLDLLLSVDLAGFKDVNLTLVVMAVSGGGTLNLTVLTSDVNDSAYFTTLDTFPDVTAVGQPVAKYNADFGRYLSLKWAVSGGSSPKFVVTVVGTAKA